MAVSMTLPLFHTLMFAWFQKHGRLLPWREKLVASSQDTGIKKLKEQHQSKTVSVRDKTLASYFTRAWRRDPYRVTISELMLQQTQVDRVLPKFEEFLQRWPTVADLANATLSEVLVAWQGLGYNRRARFLHEMARTIVTQHNGIFPKDEKTLQSLPGIGTYTARAILTFAHGEDVGVIDTNVQRIFARVYFGVEQNEIKKNAGISQKEFIQVVDEAVPKGKGDPWNQALMDFGALVCTSRSPKCETCPLKTLCEANAIAKKKGFKNYSEYLAMEAKGVNDKSKKPKNTSLKQKFHETDRYFRGRIVDKLREGPIHMEELRQHMESNHGLSDRLRWGLIVEKLVIDRLIAVRGSTVSLA